MLPLRFPKKAGGRQFTGDPAGLVSFIKHPALGQGQLQHRSEISSILRHRSDQRLAAVKRRWRNASVLIVDIAKQLTDQLAGLAQRRGNGVLLGAASLPWTAAGEGGERELAVVFGDFQFQGIAGLGRKRQGQGEVALGDYGTVGAVGQ